jgi:type VI secretion system secreted protein Hcp
MAMPIHMKLKGKTQGEIQGSCEMQGDKRNGSIFVYSLQHNITIPHHTGGVDGEASVAIGKRIHEPLVVEKQVDKATPKLYLALCTGEHFESVDIYWYRINKQGKEENYFTTKLEDAILIDMSPSFSSVGDGAHVEQLSFAYKRITWTWEIDGITATDDWTQPSE